MKILIILGIFLFLSESGTSTPVHKADAVLSDSISSSGESLHLDQQSRDQTIVLSDPIDSVSKLLIALDAQVTQYLLPPTDNVETTTSEPQVYSGELELAERQADSVTSLLDQLDALDKRIQDTISQLTARRRYMIAAMLRPMATYVRRVRSNLERLQTRLSALTSAATSSSAANNPTGIASTVVDQGVIDNIQRRVQDIQKRIGEIVGRISATFSLSAPSTTLSPVGR